MAIDTEAKRRSALSSGLPWMRLHLPPPDGTIDAADRASIYVYSGIVGALDTDGPLVPFGPLLPLVPLADED